MLTKEQKVIFLKEVLEWKKVIFGSYDNVADGKRKKKDAWLDVHKVLVANGYTKDVDELRDTQWKNIRRATMVNDICLYVWS